MKKILHFMVFCLASGFAWGQTSVADGNWSNPATWGGTVPMGSGTVIINHNVILDIDYSHTSGSITISASAELVGDSPIRGFALNYPSGNATVDNSGKFSVARVTIFSEYLSNSGIFEADSLLNYADITNNSSDFVADNLWNSTAGSLTNNGVINAVDFLNTELVSNNGSIFCNDFTNAKSFTNGNASEMNVSNDFANYDTITSPANYTNNGAVYVQNNWLNGNLIDGSGTFCIGNLSSNQGTMSGTFDFCNVNGGGVDSNTGTIDASVTVCQQTSCNVGVNDEQLSEWTLYPNPSNGNINLSVPQNGTLEIFNIQGQLVYKSSVNAGETHHDLSLLGAGVYTLHFTSNHGSQVKKMMIE